MNMNEKYHARIRQAAKQAQAKQQAPGWGRKRHMLIALAVLVCVTTITIFATIGDNYDVRVDVDVYGNAYVYPADTYHHIVRDEDGSIHMTISTGGGN